jgi:hypothetical protein
MKRPYSLFALRQTKVPGTTVTLLTATSKMPSPSWSLPAGKACPNSHGEICGHCYAQKGCYQYPDVARAQEARFRWTVESMRSESGMQSWIATMVDAIKATKCRYFRIHDSGDFFSVAYVRAWIAVCRALPGVRFWAPTREYQTKPIGLLPVLTENPRMDALRALASLPNVTIRPSALSIGIKAPSVSGLHAGSGVNDSDATPCKAYTRAGMCGNCRLCWNAKETPISYPLH